MNKNPHLSVVIPVYGNEDSLPQLVAELSAVLDGVRPAAEVVFVVDGSPDNSLEVLNVLLPKQKFDWQVIEHSRNFGSFAAIRTGLEYARGSYFSVISADLQEPTMLILDFFNELKQGAHDVVVGTRLSRDESIAKTSTSNTFWTIYRALVSKEMPKGGVDVFGCNRLVRDQLLRLNESHSSLIGQLYWLGFSRAEVPYQRLARMSGKSGWTLRKKFNYLFDSIFSFTDIPLVLLTVVGLFGAAATLLAALAVTVAYIAGAIREPGYTPLMLVIALSSFLIIAALGVVGNYVWRVFENTKARPLSVVRSVNKSL